MRCSKALLCSPTNRPASPELGRREAGIGKTSHVQTAKLLSHSSLSPSRHVSTIKKNGFSVMSDILSPKGCVVLAFPSDPHGQGERMANRKTDPHKIPTHLIPVLYVEEFRMYAVCTTHTGQSSFLIERAFYFRKTRLEKALSTQGTKGTKRRNCWQTQIPSRRLRHTDDLWQSVGQGSFWQLSPPPLFSLHKPVSPSNDPFASTLLRARRAAAGARGSLGKRQNHARGFFPFCSGAGGRGRWVLWTGRAKRIRAYQTRRSKCPPTSPTKTRETV